MAHVVGVPRRDPCRKCQLPVFLAERLMVGKKVYHRTCLKCARCGSQLTPGSFYETEVDDQYCCETCPDEEITSSVGGDVSPIAAAGGYDSLESESSDVPLRRNLFDRDVTKSPNSMAVGGNTRSVRSSIKDRLAFFEQQQFKKDDYNSLDAMDSKFLQKSLSDEEKTKSLQRMEGTTSPPPATVYKMNTALTNFLHDTVDSEQKEEKEEEKVEEDQDEEGEEDDISESIDSSLPIHKIDSSDTEDIEDLTSSTPAPELPKTMPPMSTENSLAHEKPDEQTKRYTSSAQFVLGSTTSTSDKKIIADDLENIIRTPSPRHLINDKTNNNFKDENEDHQQQAMTQTSAMQHKELENNLVFNQTNDNDCVTKDKATEDVSTMDMETDPVAAQQLDESTQTNYDPPTIDVEGTKSGNLVTPDEKQKQKVKDHKPIETSDLEVELRTTKSPQMEDHNSSAQVTGNDVETTQRLSVVRARLQQFEVITNNEKDNDKENTNTTTTITPIITATNDNKIKREEEEEEVQQNENKVNKMDFISEPPITTPVNGNEISLSRLENENENSSSPSPAAKDIEMETSQNVPETLEAAEKNSNEKEYENLVTIQEIAKETKEEKAEEVPLPMETKDNDEDNNLENKTTIEENKISEEKEKPQDSATLSKKEEEDSTKSPEKTPSKLRLEQYPQDLNPFQSDDDEVTNDDNKENEVVVMRKPPIPPQPKVISCNPFDSSDDEIELEKSQSSQTVKALSLSSSSTPKIPPPRPPPPRISRNPFGSEDEEEPNKAQALERRSSLTASQNTRTPVPTPRSNVSQSLTPTPEPTPRLSTKTNSVQHQHLLQQQHSANSYNDSRLSTVSTPQSNSYILQNSSDFYGSANSLHSSNANTPNNLLRNSDIRSSNNSLNLSAGGTIRSRKSRRAPLPPAPVKELFPSTETVNSGSKASTPSSSTVGTPKSGRKKRPAPAPPKPARLEQSTTIIPEIQVENAVTQPKNSISYPLQSELDSKLSDEEKALLEGKTLIESQLQVTDSEITLSPASRRSSKRLIPLDKELLEEDLSSQCDDLKQQQNLQKSLNQQEAEEVNVVYRRLLIPHIVDTPIHESNPLLEQLNTTQPSPTVGERQLEKLKDNKEANNRNRQSQISAASSGAEDNDPLYNKSVHGKWKRRKGPAPALPIPPRKVLQMLPLQEIKHELEIIEVQQQGLEKQGVVLEKMIRDRCENQNGEPLSLSRDGSPAGGETTTTDGSPTIVENSKEVESLILQLFELVNEKNELFRRQAELMYLRRQHRLEQEQADLEYEIRVLMAQPERNKTDSDKAREEALIERLVEVVQLRNEVVECLEMDRIREAEEDQSIKQRLESHIAQRDEVSETKAKSSTLSKLSKKEKKKQKEAKKLGKSKKLDADKDADESEISTDKQKTKKKKKLLIF